RRFLTRFAWENLRVLVGHAARIGDKKCLEVVTPPLPFSGRSNRLAATQLRLANSEEHQLHGRTQAREFSTGKSKLYRPGTVVIQDALPCWIRFRGAWPPEPSVKNKKNPRG